MTEVIATRSDTTQSGAGPTSGGAGSLRLRGARDYLAVVPFFAYVAFTAAALGFVFACGIKGPPPDFGQHTPDVLRELLGLDEAEVAGLEARGVLARCAAVLSG